MIYLYDNLICDDLRNSFNTDNSNPIVSVVGPESVVSIAAQLQNDKIKFPLLALYRDTNLTIDTNRMNFTRLHRGFPAVIDQETNDIYYERVIPIKLNYSLDVVTTRIADMDELTRELLFKYSNMYFLTLQLPYEAKRHIRFGIVIDSDSSIERKSSVSEYSSSGTLYQTTIPLRCEGCVEVSYTPAKLPNFQPQKVVIDGSRPYTNLI